METVVILDNGNRIDYAISLLEKPVKNDALGLTGYTGIYKNKRIHVVDLGSHRDSLFIRAEEIFKYNSVSLVINIGNCYSISKNRYPTGKLVFINSIFSDSNHKDLVELHSDNLCRNIGKEFEKKIITLINDLNLPIEEASCSSVTSLFTNKIEEGVSLIDLKTFYLYDTAYKHNKHSLSLLQVHELNDYKPQRDLSIDPLIELAFELSISIL